jgi:photosystem II protein PsbQ
MRIFRPILSLFLVLVTTFLVSCGSPSASAPPTYTPQKLEQIKTFRIPVDVARERLSTLADLIDQGNWVDTKSFIHGPLGLLRRDMTYLANALLPEDQKEALVLAKEVFAHLDDIDAASNDKDYATALKELNQAVKDFDAYLDLVPEAGNA